MPGDAGLRLLGQSLQPQNVVPCVVPTPSAATSSATLTLVPGQRCDNPPRNLAHPGYSFEPPCDAECMRQRPGVLDHVRVPATLKPGAYVLGFRWDCDASSQVWQQCSDIELVQ